MSGLSVPVPDAAEFKQYFSHPTGTLASPVDDMVRYIQDELNLMGKTDYVSGPEDLKKQLLDIFRKLSH